MSEPGENTRANDEASPKVLSVALLMFGLWGLAAPYLSTALGFVIPVPAKVEFVDHVVPGIIILGVALFSIFTGRLPLVGSLMALLGGFWMTMTHLPALRDGFRHIIPIQAALIHSLPGLAILAVAAAMSIKAYKLAP
ncbi:MAG: hypothetical protein ACR2FO_07170 [Actinomycetota bacterium]